MGPASKRGVDGQEEILEEQGAENDPFEAQGWGGRSGNGPKRRRKAQNRWRKDAKGQDRS
jgi:hypothetical protein